MSEHLDADLADERWGELLEDAATAAGGDDFRVEDDVRRGRTRLLRNRVGAATAAVCVGVVVLGGGLALGHDTQGARPLPAGPGPSTVATFHEPPVTLSPSSAPVTALAPGATWLQKRLNAEGDGAPRTPFKAWRTALFETTRSVLDPTGSHLDYSSDGITASTFGRGVSIGIKMGWSETGSDGQGMVEVQVGDERAVEDACLETGGFGCPRAVHVDGAQTWVGDGPRGSFVVLHRQADGDQVVVLVDPVFGNNTQTPVGRGLVSKADVYRLVQDDRLDLPHRTP